MKNRVLLVDDEVNILHSFKRNLRGHFEFDLANSGKIALEMMDITQYSVIVTDMQMPEMNGVTLLQQVKERYPDVIRIMLTGNADQQTAIDAVNVGDIFKFLNKPCSTDLLKSVIDDAFKQYNLVVAEKVLLNKTLKSVINVLNEVLFLVNPEATEHNSELKRHMLNLRKALNLKSSWSFEPMIELSQLGSIIFPKYFVGEGKGLSQEELQLFEQHPCLAYDLIRKIPRMESIANTILYQEKSFNGEGVPHDHVSGKDIPIGARMLKVVLDFLKAKSLNLDDDKAVDTLDSHPERYDPKILEAFKKTLEIEEQKRTVSLKDLKLNMILVEDIRTKRGQLVAKGGQKVTESMRHIIDHCVSNGAISGAVAVTIMEEEPADPSYP